MIRVTRFIPALILILITSSSLPAQAPASKCTGSNNVNYAMYLTSQPKDRSDCHVTVSGGNVSFGAGVTNPAMSCPDAFAWKLLADSVNQEFWTNWATDDQTWPGQPYKPCTGAAGSDCCDLNSVTQNPANCPFFPGAARTASSAPKIRTGVPPSKTHMPVGTSPMQMQTLMAALGTTDPDRAIRQSMTEVVFRNEPMLGYVRSNNLYNTQGVVAVFNNVNGNIRPGAPYRLASTPGRLSEIDFPTTSIMIKSDWIVAKYAPLFGIKENPAHPFIKMTINSATDPVTGKPIAAECWLLGVHFSSKDIPNWVWTTFEHVDNPGRCDYIGCNDSFGFTTPDKVAAGQATNFTAPKTSCDNLITPGFVYDLGKGYAGGTITAELQTLLNGLHVGDGPVISHTTVPMIMPNAHDPAWRSYRLKGSQTEFTDSVGRAGILGNSITEAGFVQTSSCISCHARSSTNATGTVPLPLGVFINETNETGYLQSHRGIPNSEWYNASAQPPSQITLQTDFVWGFLAASAIYDPTKPTLQATPKPKSPRDIIRENH